MNCAPKLVLAFKVECDGYCHTFFCLYMSTELNGSACCLVGAWTSESHSTGAMCCIWTTQPALLHSDGHLQLH